MVQHHHVTGLLTTERVPVGAHLLEDIPVSDRGLHQPDPGALHRQAQAEVAHHGGDQRLVGEGAAIGEGQRQDGHDLVAVHLAAQVVDRQAAVGVTVVRDSGVGAERDHRIPQPGQVSRPVAVVDVEAVRIGADHDHLGSGRPEGLRGDHAGRSMSAIQDDPQPVQPVRQGLQQVLDVAAGRVRQASDPADFRAGRTVPGLAHPLLDLVLDLIRKLVPTPGEELDPVVRHRVVRGREDDAEVRAGGRHQVGDRRGRHHADVLDIDPRAGQPGDHRGREELPRGPRVATDDGSGTATAEVRDLTEDMRRRDREIKGQLGGEVTIGEPSHAVGAE